MLAIDRYLNFCIPISIHISIVVSILPDFSLKNVHRYESVFTADRDQFYCNSAPAGAKGVAAKLNQSRVPKPLSQALSVLQGR